MTENTQGPARGSWKALADDLKSRGAEGERNDFFPLQAVESGQHVRLAVVDGPFFQPEQMHGQFSLVELEVFSDADQKRYRLCVSGARLAKAMAAVEPKAGTVLVLTAKGTGKGRTWAVSGTEQPIAA